MAAAVLVKTIVFDQFVASFLNVFFLSFFLMIIFYLCDLIRAILSLKQCFFSAGTTNGQCPLGNQPFLKPPFLLGRRGTPQAMDKKSYSGYGRTL